MTPEEPRSNSGVTPEQPRGRRMTPNLAKTNGNDDSGGTPEQPGATSRAPDGPKRRWPDRICATMDISRGILPLGPLPRTEPARFRRPARNVVISTGKLTHPGVCAVPGARGRFRRTSSIPRGIVVVPHLACGSRASVPLGDTGIAKNAGISGHPRGSAQTPVRERSAPHAVMARSSHSPGEMMRSAYGPCGPWRGNSWDGPE